MECEVNLRKSKQAFIARSEEYEKAKTAAFRAEEEGGGATAKSVERKRRLEEEARNKVIINHLTYWRMRFHMEQVEQGLPYTSLISTNQFPNSVF